LPELEAGIVEEHEQAHDVAEDAEGPVDMAEEEHLVETGDDADAAPVDQAELPDVPDEVSEGDLDSDTQENLRMLRRLGAKGTDAELLAQLKAKKKQEPADEDKQEELVGKKKRWWSR
jgi:hypothetical protein